MSFEIWKPIPGYEGHYEVSDLGRVKSLNFGHRPGIEGILACNTLSRGYFRVKLLAGRRPTVHSLVCLAFIGTRPKGFQINHKNGIKTDNRSENLEYCTASENTKHSFRLGLQSKKGEKHSLHKLTEAQVREIYKLSIAGEMIQREIAVMYGIKRQAVGKIKDRINWGHLQMESEG